MGKDRLFYLQQKCIVKSMCCRRSGANASSVKSGSGGNHTVDCLLPAEFPWRYARLTEQVDHRQYREWPVHIV